MCSPGEKGYHPMKDISTCRYKPHRLWEWCELAVEVAEEVAKV